MQGQNVAPTNAVHGSAAVHSTSVKEVKLDGGEGEEPAADTYAANAATSERNNKGESFSVHDKREESLDKRTSTTSLRDEEQDKLGKKIFFHRDGNRKYQGWDNLRWMSLSGSRKIQFVAPVYQFVAGRRTLFWSGDQYLERKLVVFSEPHLIMVLRPPEDMAEVLQILDLPPGASPDNSADIFASYLVVESVVEPTTCKLRLSPLTTVTSVLRDVKIDDFRRRSCFELLTPMESIILSAVRLRKGAERALTSFTDSGAFLETSSVEHVLLKSVCDAHRPTGQLPDSSGLSWKHQVILGTLHSHVILGNQSTLVTALNEAKARSEDETSEFVDTRIIDAIDESGRTPLHYACAARFSSAVAALVSAGANVDIRAEPYDMTPCHLSALHLDSKSLQTILSINKRPNVIDSWGRTPFFLAVTEGRSVGHSRDPTALENCIGILKAHGAQVEPPMGFPHPVNALASAWSHQELAVVLKHVNYRYPLALASVRDEQKTGISVSALYQYPVHASLIAIRRSIQNTVVGSPKFDASQGKSLSM